MKLFRVVLNVTPQVVNACSGDHRIEGKYLVMVIAENAADALLQVQAEYDGTDAKALEVSMVAVRQHEGDELAIMRIVAKQADYAADTRLRESQATLKETLKNTAENFKSAEGQK